MSRPKEVYGKKLIYHYSAPVIFTLLFSLLAIAAFVLTFFMPYIHGTVDLTGLDFAKYGYNLFNGDKVEAMEYYINEFSNVLADIPFNVVIVQIWMYVLVFDLILMTIFAVILSIGALVLLLSGRLKKWKLPYKCIGGLFWPGIFFYGTVIGMNIYSGLIKKGPTYDGLYAYIFLGVFFVSMIVTHVIYSKAFKNHVYVKNMRTLNKYIEEYEKENMVVDTSTKHPEEEVIIEEAPKIVMLPADDQTENNSSSDNRKKLPRGIKHIGGHAFSQNTVLEEADIPLGIEVLGAGAFANCVNLKYVNIPESVKKIEYNCFFNCIRLERITYGGSREMWKRIKRGSNWLTAAGTKFVVCRDGALAVDPEK